LGGAVHPGRGLRSLAKVSPNRSSSTLYRDTEVACLTGSTWRHPRFSLRTATGPGQVWPRLRSLWVSACGRKVTSVPLTQGKQCDPPRKDTKLLATFTSQSECVAY